MRQVNEAEIVWNLKFALSRLSATFRNGLASRHADARRDAEQLIAIRLAEHLRRYEILSDAPLPPGTDLFTQAAYGQANGSSPSIEEDKL